MESEINIIAWSITLLLGILSFYFGGRYAQSKLVAKLVVEALADDKITPEEAQGIAKAIKKLIS